MTFDLERLSPSAKRVRDEQERVEKMRKDANGFRNKPGLHRLAIRTFEPSRRQSLRENSTHDLRPMLLNAWPPFARSRDLRGLLPHAVDFRSAGEASSPAYPSSDSCHSAASPAAASLPSKSAPVSWSTTRIESRTLPRSSKPISLTFTFWPSFTTSEGLLTRPLASWLT